MAMVVPCRAFRLRITKLYSPAIANSVQLACWNLYQSTPAWTAQDRTAAGYTHDHAIMCKRALLAWPGFGGRQHQLALHPLAFEPSSLTLSVCVCLCCAAGSREAAARAAVAAKQDTPALQLSILTKLLSNIATNPTDNKFRYVSL